MCAQKNERLTHLFYENFPFGPFPRFPCCGIFFFYSSEFMCRVLFFYFFMGIKVAFLIPPPHTFVTHDETNQAKCKNQVR